ncbi:MULTISPECIES: DUF4402 domain-containing protein [Vibrio]|uniref:DUF4402 domain-containing protein n=3 Tax=Vibrio cyclitrophicus TaxID=47951 RepID=A0A7Z1S2S5_9VIBR|nr:MULTISPECIES: DUF4402 domain-containing protein [Vibrio]KNH12653.1 hypothetical protein ACS79_10305 [Vibrio lentus]MBY7660087.1 DUF4402 domain-containing protein [Vibrio atlanticus]KAA8600187.1 hypothetical protein F0Z19_2109 [Vibrio cyclitrophicus]MBE8556291.1 DUF4402 domain-containing protein [Vibrio sp. OPT24]MBE8605818.1 DUF4402 domain-containing protein [Vibrio sp. OPT10]|tara:strand:+ start:1424 stop:1861 length:438 start_codon:yes stop_codon:yes gene_type:complete
MNFFLKYVACIGLIIYSSPFHALEIIPENMEVKFPGMYISGSGQNADANPANGQVYVVRFYAEGEPGKKIVVSLPSKQYLNHSRKSKRLRIRKFYFGCGLSKRGRAKIQSNGRSKLLCIGAKVKIGANHPAGIYTSTIPFEVNYK